MSISEQEIERFLNLPDDALIDQLTEIFVRDFENDIPDVEITLDSSDLRNPTYFINKLGNRYVISHGGKVLDTDISAFLLLRRFWRFKKLYHNDRIICKFR